MKEFQCSSEFGPDDTLTAESSEDAAELYAEDHVDMDVDDPPNRVYVTVVDPTEQETEVPIDITIIYQFKSGVE